MIAAMDTATKPKRRWKTISLRGLLLLVVAIAVWLGWIVHKARQQRATVAALQKFGGFVHYDWEFVDGPVKVPQGNLLWTPTWGQFKPDKKPWAPVWLRQTLGDEYFQSIAHVSLFVDIKTGVADATWVNMVPADDALRMLATQQSVRTLLLGGSGTDDNLAYVGQMTGLEELSISWGYRLTDKAFAHLGRLKNFRILDIDSSKMTDAGLETIGKLTNLEELRIAGAGFSDKGLAHLQNLARLKHLSLGEGDHAISDAAARSLTKLKQLEYVDIAGWHIGDRGIAKLGALKNLKKIGFGIPTEQAERKKHLQTLLPGVAIQ